MSEATYFQKRIYGVLHTYMEVNGKTIEIPSYYWKTEQKFDFPKVWMYNNELASSFGDYHFYNINDYFKDIERINDELCHPKHPISFGPYIDFEQLRDSKTYSIDDFFVQYKPGDNHFTIWDHNITDNNPRIINWLDRRDRQKPIIFKPIISLKSVPKTVDIPRSNLQNNQSSVENMVFRLIAKLGFDRYPNDYTPRRFFKPNTPGWDSSVLFRFAQNSFKWIMIDSAHMEFWIHDICDGNITNGRNIKTTTQLANALREIKVARDKYLIKTYGTHQQSH